jgi:hypothetical protein
LVNTSDMAIDDLVLGDCNFSFVTTPTTSNLLFTGVILGSSTKKCTVYTITFHPTTTGTKGIDITKGSIKRYGDAAELFTSPGEATFTITSPNPLALDTYLPTTKTAQSVTEDTQTAVTSDGYTVAIKVLSSNNMPVQNAVVTLSPQLQTGGAMPKQLTTDVHGIARFTSINPDMYTVHAITKDGNPIASNIVNVKGTQKVLTLGLQEEKQPFNSIPYLVAGMILVVATLLLTLFRGRLRALFIKPKSVVSQQPIQT